MSESLDDSGSVTESSDRKGRGSNREWVELMAMSDLNQMSEILKSTECRRIQRYFTVDSEVEVFRCTLSPDCKKVFRLCKWKEKIMDSFGNECVATLFEVQGESHFHPNSIKMHGLSDDQKAVVDDCLARNQGQPKKVLQEFSRLKACGKMSLFHTPLIFCLGKLDESIPNPSTSQITNYKSNIKSKLRGGRVGDITLQDIGRWAQEHKNEESLLGPSVHVDQPFVAEYKQIDQDFTSPLLWIAMSTLRLMNLNSNKTDIILYVDSTYKLNRQGYPVHIGQVDANQLGQSTSLI